MNNCTGLYASIFRKVLCCFPKWLYRFLFLPQVEDVPVNFQPCDGLNKKAHGLICVYAYPLAGNLFEKDEEA